VDVELSQTLRVNEVRDSAGKPLAYDRDEITPTEIARHAGRIRCRWGGKSHCNSSMRGRSQAEEPARMRGVQLAHIDKDGGYLLLPGALVPAHGLPHEPLYRRFPDRSSRNNGRRRYRHIGRSSDICHTQNFSCPTHWELEIRSSHVALDCPAGSFDGERTLTVHVPRGETRSCRNICHRARYN